MTDRIDNEFIIIDGAPINSKEPFLVFEMLPRNESFKSTASTQISFHGDSKKQRHFTVPK